MGEGGCERVGIGHPGPDCAVPKEFVTVGSNLLVSWPRLRDEALHSVIHSETVTGLRMDYRNVWQLNRRMLSQTTSKLKAQIILRLFWIQQTPVSNLSMGDLQFSELKSYGETIMLRVLICYVLYLCVNFLVYVLFFY